MATKSRASVSNPFGKTFQLRKDIEKKYSVKDGIIVGAWITNPVTKDRTVHPSWLTGKPIWLPVILTRITAPDEAPKRSYTQTVTITAEEKCNFPGLQDSDKAILSFSPTRKLIGFQLIKVLGNLTTTK